MPTGTVVHRIHLSRFASASFNPCQGQPTRFAPIQDAHGQCVPSLYAGSNFEAAAFETLFHDVGTKGEIKTVPKRSLTERTHSAIQTKRELRLAKLFAPDLKPWQISRQSLIGSSPALYGATALWAVAIHHQFPQIDGLVWTSNQCDPELAYLFYGDRVVESEFDVVFTRDGTSDPDFLTDARTAGLRASIYFIV